METGDESAFEEIFQRYYKRVYRRVLPIVNNHEDADEITSTTFFKAYHKLGTLTQKQSLAAWLRSIARNTCIDHLRAKKPPENIQLLSFDVFSDLEETDTPSILAEASILVERQIAQQSAQKELLEKLVRLVSEKNGILLELYLDGMKHEEIAAALNITAKAVESRLARVKTWLGAIAPRLDELLENLPAKEYAMMERYLDGKSIAEIAEALDVSRSSVQDSLERVRKRWRRTIAKEIHDESDHNK